MIELDSHIEAFKFYVKAQVKNLLARGEASSDLLVNLFKGYKMANDVEFADFIKHKEMPTKRETKMCAPTRYVGLPGQIQGSKTHQQMVGTNQGAGSNPGSNCTDRETQIIEETRLAATVHSDPSLRRPQQWRQARQQWSPRQVVVAGYPAKGR
jgi:hypothetical protein